MIESREPIGIVIRLSPDHHAIDMFEVPVNFCRRFDAAVDHHRQMRKLLFQSINVFIPEWWHFPILLGTQPFENGIAGMHDEYIATRFTDGADKIAYEPIVVEFVDTDTVLDRHRQRDRIHHCFHAIGYQLRFGHQAGAETAALHAFRRAAAIQVYLVIAPALAQFRANGEVAGSLPPSCSATGCSSVLKSRWRG